MKALTLGTLTKWGRIKAVGMIGGERYYWIIDKRGDVAMVPAVTVEKQRIYVR